MPIMKSKGGAIVEGVTTDSIFIKLFISHFNISKFIQINALTEGSSTLVIFIGLLISPAFLVINEK